MPNDQHGPLTETSKTTDDRWVVPEAAVTVDFSEIGKDSSDVVQRMRSTRVAGNKHLLPWGERRVDLSAERIDSLTKLLQLLVSLGRAWQQFQCFDLCQSDPDRLFEL